MLFLGSSIRQNKKMKEILFSIHPLLSFCKFFGFLPLNILNVKDKKSTTIYILIIAFYTSMYSYVSYVRLTLQYGQALKGSNLSKIAYYLSVVLMLTMMIMLMVGNFLRREKFTKMLKIFKWIDSKVSDEISGSKLKAQTLKRFYNFFQSFSPKTRENCLIYTTHSKYLD